MFVFPCPSPTMVNYFRTSRFHTCTKSGPYPVYICAVCIPPDANAKLALAQLYDNMNKSVSACPDRVFVAAGDFNHVDL